MSLPNHTYDNCMHVNKFLKLLGTQLGQLSNTKVLGERGMMVSLPEIQLKATSRSGVSEGVYTIATRDLVGGLRTIYLNRDRKSTR